jgi:hypothetical protein
MESHFFCTFQVYVTRSTKLGYSHKLQLNVNRLESEVDAVPLENVSAVLPEVAKIDEIM